MLQFEIIPVTPFAQNCTLLWDDDTRDAVLIDAGGDVAKLEAALKKHDLTLTALWLTHGHLDHVGGVGELAERHKVPVIGPHPDEQFWLDVLPQQALLFRFPEPKEVTVTSWSEHGQLLVMGLHLFEVRWTPGHTPGHIVIISRELNLVWTGDVLFAGSIGRTDFPKGNHAQLIDSIHRELFTLPDDMRFIPGHGPMSTIGQEKRTNPFVSGRAG